MSAMFRLLTGGEERSTRHVTVDKALSWESIRLARFEAGASMSHKSIVCLVSPNRMAELASLFGPGFCEHVRQPSLLPGVPGCHGVIAFDGCVYVEDVEQGDGGLLYLDMEVTLAPCEVAAS